jgi:hypothetical protein
MMEEQPIPKRHVAYIKYTEGNGQRAMSNINTETCSLKT